MPSPGVDQDQFLLRMQTAAAVRQGASAKHYLANAERAEKIFTPLLRVIGRIFDVPIVEVNVLDCVHQYTVATLGTTIQDIPREESLCDLVVARGALVTLDSVPRPMTWRAEGLGTYIGIPIFGRERVPIGSLCLLDYKRRTFSDDEIDEFRMFSQLIADEFELIRQSDSTESPHADPDELADAIFSGTIVPRYQPIVDLKSGRVVAAEALARWTHPARGAISPATFIAQAEESDLIIDLDLAILRTAVRDAMAWRRAAADIRLNVNLSANHFENPNGPERLMAVIRDAGADPTMITFEVTETRLIHGCGAEDAFLEALHTAGHRVVLDDFGVGYSSVNRLLRLPVDGLKLDSSVTASLAQPTGTALMRNIIRLADDLNLSTVVEGIETPWQVMKVRRLGGSVGQGRLWSDAVDHEDIVELIKAPLTAGRSSLLSRAHAAHRAARRPWSIHHEGDSWRN